jgi:preprotein translocase subunit SecE
MPTKKAKSAKKPASSTVTRIKATDSTPAAKAEKTTKVKAVETATPAAETKKTKKTKKRGVSIIFVPFKALGGYFKGAWVELRQVRWPTRRATWGLTGAVLAYSAFFIVIVLLLDAGFKYLFEFILKK